MQAYYEFWFRPSQTDNQLSGLFLFIWLRPWAFVSASFSASLFKAFLFLRPIRGEPYKTPCSWRFLPHVFNEIILPLQTQKP